MLHVPVVQLFQFFFHLFQDLFGFLLFQELFDVIFFVLVLFAQERIHDIVQLRECVHLLSTYTKRIEEVLIVNIGYCFTYVLCPFYEFSLQIVQFDPSHMFSVHPFEFLIVEDYTLVGNISWVEGLEPLFYGEYLVSFHFPAKKGKIVHQGPAQDSLFSEMLNGGCTMPFTEGSSVWSQYERNVHENRCFPAERFVDHDLLWCVRKVVFSSEDMGNLHQMIVYYDGKVVRGKPVRFHDDEILYGGVVEFHLSFQQVFERGLSWKDFEFHRDRMAFSGVLFGIVERGKQFSGGIFFIVYNVIGPLFFHQFSCVFTVDIEPFALAIRTMISIHIGPFIPVKSTPSQRVKDLPFEFHRTSLQIGVLYPQNEFSALFSCEHPVEKGSPCSSNVKVSRWARCKSNSDQIEHLPIFLSPISNISKKAPVMNTGAWIGFVLDYLTGLTLTA
ncbi:Putative uncharacterized protein [Thermotoga neapolitana DSM 4359]|uniref:Uncharacterized protein n=1 Tax=Thermotoga neapolitana (strain ATCC 49049 / DSM 4359 / NBRC 107923 / NS-E) TaxID=309803 RepID=B9K7Q3_THENN|nr:Putative uncharacterized protein [Thermotoga neapolitana DSM 4359]